MHKKQREDYNSPRSTNCFFLWSEQNKYELLNYLIDCIQSYDVHGKVPISTFGKIVVTLGQVKNTGDGNKLNHFGNHSESHFLSQHHHVMNLYIVGVNSDVKLNANIVF